MKTLNYLLVLTTIMFNINTNAQIKVLSNGNTGVGVSTPLEKLQVGSGGSIYLEGTNGTSLWFGNNALSGNRFRISQFTSMTNFDFYPELCFRGGVSNTCGITRLKINLNGNVGIGTFNPQYLLDVAGQIRVVATVYPSDIRLKENIKSLSNPLSSLTQLNGKSYKYKLPETKSQFQTNRINSITGDSTVITDTSTLNDYVPIDTSFYSREHFGFVAQELQSVFPELVYEDSNGILSIDYVSLIPIIVESIKEMDQRITDNEQLQAELQSTKDQLADIQLQLKTCCKKSNLKSEPVGTIAEVSLDGAVLYQNAPNPFNHTTQISFYLPENVKTATIYIYDMQGKQIKNIPIIERGNGEVTISGSELKSGMFLYTLVADNEEIDTKRMILTD